MTFDAGAMALEFNKLARQVNSEHVRHFGRAAVPQDESLFPGSGRWRLYSSRPYDSARTGQTTPHSHGSTSCPPSPALSTGTSRDGVMGASARSRASASSAGTAAKMDMLRDTFKAEKERRLAAEAKVKALRREIEVMATGITNYQKLPRAEDRISTARKQELAELAAEQKLVDFEWERRRQLALAEADKKHFEASKRM